MAPDAPNPDYEIRLARERLTDSLSNALQFQADIEIAKLQTLQSIAHALVAIAQIGSDEIDRRKPYVGKVRPKL